MVLPDLVCCFRGVFHLFMDHEPIESGPTCIILLGHPTKSAEFHLPVTYGDAVAVPTVELCLVVAGVDVDLEAISLLGVGLI